MNRKYKTLALALAASVLTIFYACKDKDDDKEPNPVIPGNPLPGVVKVEIEPVAGTDPLQYSKYYKNAVGDSFNVSLLKYYVSNIKLEKEDGSYYIQPESYFLVNHNNGTYELSIPNVPAGKYKGVQLIMGIDSTRHVSGAQTGALDPANDMFWTWSSGYIQFKIEGQVKNPTASFIYHIGGFQGINKTQKDAYFSFGSDRLQVNNNTTKIHLAADVLKIFDTPTSWEIRNLPNISSAGANARNFANQYADMLRFEHIHN